MASTRRKHPPPRHLLVQHDLIVVVVLPLDRYALLLPPLRLLQLNGLLLGACDAGRRVHRVYIREVARVEAQRVALRANRGTHPQTWHRLTLLLVQHGQVDVERRLVLHLLHAGIGKRVGLIGCRILFRLLRRLLLVLFCVYVCERNVDDVEVVTRELRQRCQIGVTVGSGPAPRRRLQLPSKLRTGRRGHLGHVNAVLVAALVLHEREHERRQHLLIPAEALQQVTVLVVDVAVPRFALLGPVAMFEGARQLLLFHHTLVQALTCSVG